MSPIESAFENGPAFIPYLAAGDPTVERSRAYVEALARGGADVIELGLPFSEPIAEGPTIQRAVVRSLEGGMTPERYFDFVETLDVGQPLVCMTYYNLVYQYGEAEGPRPFVERADDAGIDGFVIPDLPVEESNPLVQAAREFGLDPIFIVAPTTSAARRARIRELVSGYVYVQARLGTTGARGDVSAQTAESLARLTDWQLPKAVGFGISSGEQARRVVEAGADGVIVGSALVDIVAEGIEAGDETDAVAARLESLARELKEGARAGGEVGAEPERT